jgi:hypothetical protein
MPGLVQPYKEFVQRGWINLTVVLSAMDTKVVARVSSEVDKDKSNVDLSAAQAKALIIAKGLWTPKGGQKNPSTKKEEGGRPSRSLTVDDFSDGPAKVLARTLAIAKLQGDTTARGRIGSLKLMIEGADTFEKWWASAKSEDKLRLFTDEKHRAKIPDKVQQQFAKAVGECPFLGSVPTPSKEED